MNRSITFAIEDEHDGTGRHLNVTPSLTNVCREKDGEWIVLAIAANCVRMLAKRDGLDGALDRLNSYVINSTRVVK